MAKRSSVCLQKIKRAKELIVDTVYTTYTRNLYQHRKYTGHRTSFRILELQMYMIKSSLPGKNIGTFTLNTSEEGTGASNV